MGGKVIIIEGYLASGKSTFARRLSVELNMPYLITDTFKSALCRSVITPGWNESSRFSAVTFDAMMYVAERLMETRVPFIIEGNFVPPGVKKVNEAGVIKALLEKHACAPLAFKFTGEIPVLHKRYVERNALPERGDANRFSGETPPHVFETYCRNLDAFHVGGEAVRVDTTDFAAVDYDCLIRRAQKFIKCKPF